MTQCTIQLPRQQQKEKPETVTFLSHYSYIFIPRKINVLQTLRFVIFSVENSDCQIVKSNIGKVSFNFQLFIDKIIKFEGLTMADFITHRGNKSDRILQNKDKQKQKLIGTEGREAGNLQPANA